MSSEIKPFFIGKECNRCEALGVRCKQIGLLTFGESAKIGEVVVYLNEKFAFITSEKIDDCPVIQGKNSEKEVVSKIKENAEVAKSLVRFIF